MYSLRAVALPCNNVGFSSKEVINVPGTLHGVRSEEASTLIASLPPSL